MLYFALTFSLGTLLHTVLSVIPATYDCVDDKLTLKYYGDECLNDTDCYGQSSMLCEHGQCFCKENFVPSDRFVGEQGIRRICVPGPTLNNECSTVCQKPFVCKEHARLKAKICQCISPFKMIDNFCQLECKENETYSHVKFTCSRACEANEIKVDDTCLPLASVAEKCNVDNQCLAAFSECQNGTCVCLDGFSLDENGNCMPKELVCPNNNVIKVPRKCTLTKARSDAEKTFEHDCLDGDFCFIFDGTSESEGVSGFCCPKVEPTCPVGKPHQKASCSSFSADYCPWSTHECVTMYSGSDGVCCPRSCGHNKIPIGGKCYPPVQLSNQCVYDKQCSTKNSACVNGICKCMGKATQQKVGAYSYCRMRCHSDEIMHGDHCYKLLSLGDSCTNETWRCPRGAKCNKFNVCSCRCPQFTLDKDICAPVPKCPVPKRHTIFHALGAAMPLKTEQEKYYEPITTEKRRELLENVTFCSIPRRKPPSNVNHVKKCPLGQYCANYITNLGICCRIPEYICPDGKKPISVGKCSTRRALSCGLDAYCHDFLQTANTKDIVGKMCCSAVEESATGDDIIDSF